MQKNNIVIGCLLLLAVGYYGYTVFLADDALVKRTVKTETESGGYQVITKRTDGSSIIETYELDANGSPLSHELISVGAEPGSEPVIMKKGTFVPKHQ